MAVLDWAVIIQDCLLSLDYARMYPVILGAGPAGLSCANALLSFGLHPIVIELGSAIGGAQRANFHPNLWLLGTPPEESGRAMTTRIAQHFASLPIAVYRNTALLAMNGTPGRLELELQTPEENLHLLASELVIATGTRPRSSVAIDILATESNRVHIGPLDETTRNRYHGARVLILGGGDNALDHARLLGAQDCEVEVCARSHFGARPHFLSTVSRESLIQLHEHCIPTQLIATTNGIEARFGSACEPFDALIVLWGYQPNSEVIQRFAPHLRPICLSSGHIDTDRWQRSSVGTLYAAGDVTDTPQPSVAVAVAQGLTAARAIEQDQRARFT